MQLYKAQKLINNLAFIDVLYFEVLNIQIRMYIQISIELEMYKTDTTTIRICLYLKNKGI